MSDGRIHPVCPGAPTRESARVAHRSTGREGRVSPQAAPDGHVRILFDGDSTAVNVPVRSVQYLDAADGNRRQP